MQRKDWFVYVVLPLLIGWGVDRVTKVWASAITDVSYYGPMGLMLHHNPGVILGTFSDLPPLLRIVSLSSGGIFLVFCFVVLQYIIPPGLLVLRSGMSLLLGGILGNVSDRIMYGHIIDFIFFKYSGGTSPVFNIADAIQWVGYVMIMASLVRDGKMLWPDQNLRKSFLINPLYQLKYSFLLAIFAMCFSLLAGILSYTFLKVTITELAGMDPVRGSHLLTTFSITFSLVSATFCLLCFLVGFVISHKAAGPIFAFERFLEELFAGHTRGLKLRAGDEFLHLEKLADKLLSHWKDKNSA